MTEPTSPLGATALATPPAEMAPPIEELTDNRRRKLLVAGVVVAVLVLAAAAYFLFFKGSSAGPTTFTPPAGAVAGGTSGVTSGAGTPTAPAGTVLPKAAHHPVGRDPFKALVLPTTAPVGDTGTTGTSPVTVSSHKGSGPSTGPSSNPKNGNGNGNPPPPAPAVQPTYVELVTVNGRHAATFIVGYSNFRTKRFTRVRLSSSGSATVFGKDFALLSINGHYVTVKVGDGTPFDLHPGFKHRHSA